MNKSTLKPTDARQLSLTTMVAAGMLMCLIFIVAAEASLLVILLFACVAMACIITSSREWKRYIDQCIENNLSTSEEIE